MKIADLIKTYHLEELLKLASGECNNDISDSLLFILDDNKCVKEEHKKFCKNNKNRNGEKNITDPIKREKDIRQLLYVIFCFFAVLILDFVFIYNNFFGIIFLRKFMLFLNIIIMCISFRKTYKTIGTL